MPTLDDVRPGDVLLFRGRGLIPWAIRLFDGREVNHAAIALPGGQLGEAAAAGLRRHDLATAVAANRFTDVRRLDSDDLGPVLTRADRFLTAGSGYAYHQILLLAILAVTRRIPAPRAARRLVRSALDHAATALGDLLPGGAQRMICSEFVFRCYAEALEPPPHAYELAIDLAATFASDGAEEGTFLDWALAQEDRDVDLPPAATFDATGDDTLRALDGAEAELEVLIADYAEGAGLADELPDDGPIAVTFGASDDAAEPTDDELLESMAAFGVALQDTGPVAPTFGVDVAALGAVALQGALAGILDVSVDANFVTPGDLLYSSSLTPVYRFQP